MTTTAYQGRGSHLALSTDGISFTSVAQIRKFDFAGLDATLVDITNLDSPTAFKEWLPTIIDPKDISFDGVLDPENPAITNLLTYLQNQTLLSWKITLKDSSTITFQGYVTNYKPVTVEYSKELTFSGKLQITGAVTLTAA